MRIGLFGGTFDPVHLAHLRVALEVRETFRLDRVVLIPSAVPPHKMGSHVTDPNTRVRMLRAAIEDNRGFVVSDIELKRRGPSYTIDTIRQYQEDLAGEGRLYLIVGSDAFLEIDTWKSYSNLLSGTELIVMRRPAIGGLTDDDDVNRIRIFVRDHLSEAYSYQVDLSRFVHPEHSPIHLTKVTAMHISSTRIRRLVREGKSIRFLVPESVEQIIANKGLYQ